MLCGLRRGRQRPAKGWRPWWERANIVNERRHCLFLRRQIRAGLPACFCVSIVVWRLESSALLQRVITRSKSIVLIRPAGQRCASMALALCVLATQTCATGTSPGTRNRTSLSSASACSILEVWAWLPVVIMTDQSYGGNNLVPLKYTWDYTFAQLHIYSCVYPCVWKLVIHHNHWKLNVTKTKELLLHCYANALLQIGHKFINIYG